MNELQKLIAIISDLTPFQIRVSLVAKEVALLYNKGIITKEDLCNIRSLLEDLLSKEGYTKDGFSSEKLSKYRLEEYDKYIYWFTEKESLLKTIDLLSKASIDTVFYNTMNMLYAEDKDMRKALGRLKDLLSYKSVVYKTPNYDCYIDKEIVDLVAYLNNEIGVITVFSCYGHMEGVSYIDIEGAYDIKSDYLQVDVRELREDIAKMHISKYITRISSKRVDNSNIQLWLENFMLFRKSVLSLTREDFKNKESI